MIEGLTDEVMVLVERSPAGLSLAEIYRQSELAETEQDVAGALHRLTSRGDLVKGTDKVYRTTRQGREQRLAPPPERPAEPEPKPERQAAKKKAVREKASADVPIRDATAEELDRFDRLRREVFEALENEVKELSEKLFERQNRIDTVDAEVGERHADLRRSMGNFVTDFRPGAPVVSSDFAELLERASYDAQEHLDAYLSELDDPVLDYLIEVANSTKEIAEAARAAAGGSE